MQRIRTERQPDRPGGRTRNYARFGRMPAGEEDNSIDRDRDEFREMYAYANQNFGRGGGTEGYRDFETGHTHEGFRGGGYELGGTDGTYHAGAREWQEDTTISDYVLAGSDGYSRGEAYVDGPHRGRGPRGYRRRDERIHEDVCQALTQDPGVDASEIEVEVNQGTVVLKGHVPSRKMKRRAELAIDDVPGIDDVRNELRIETKIDTQEEGR